MKKFIILTALPLILYGCSDTEKQIQPTPQVKQIIKAESHPHEAGVSADHDKKKEVIDEKCRQMPDGKWSDKCEESKHEHEEGTVAHDNHESCEDGACPMPDGHEHTPGTPDHDDSPAEKRDDGHHAGEENIAPHRD